MGISRCLPHAVCRCWPSLYPVLCGSDEVLRMQQFELFCLQILRSGTSTLLIASAPPSTSNVKLNKQRPSKMDEARQAKNENEKMGIEEAKPLTSRRNRRERVTLCRLFSHCILETYFHGSSLNTTHESMLKKEVQPLHIGVTQKTSANFRCNNRCECLRRHSIFIFIPIMLSLKY